MNGTVGGIAHANHQSLVIAHGGSNNGPRSAFRGKACIGGQRLPNPLVSKGSSCTVVLASARISRATIRCSLNDPSPLAQRAHTAFGSPSIRPPVVPLSM